MKFFNVLFINTLLICMTLISCGDKKGNIDEGNPPSTTTPVDIVKGSVKSQGTGVSEVYVTDGYGITKTDSQGDFQLTLDSRAQYIYITSPSGYTVAVENSVPQFYKEITAGIKNNGAHFVLQKVTGGDNKHHIVAIGDPQVRNQAEVDKLQPILNYLKEDIKNNFDAPVHTMVVGDIVFDVSSMHEASKNAFASLGVPVYYAIGNHDHIPNKNSPASISYDKPSERDYLKNYGPKYYSFDKGQVHYIVFDNIIFSGGPNTDYDVNISEEQMQWIRKDLSYVASDKVVILMSHSPTKSRVKAYYGNSPELFSMLTRFKDVHILTGHTHYNSVMYDNTNITDHIVGAICGGWWEGEVCPDGTPVGYKIFDIDGTDVKWRYKSKEFPEDQFTVYAPKGFQNVQANTDNLMVNVWDWDSRWIVEWSEDSGPFKTITRVSQRTYDPLALALYGDDNSTSIPAGRGWINASRTDHLFEANINPSTNKIIIKVVNPFGKEFLKTITR